MKELIKTTKNDNGEILVSGRELHEYLGVKTRYNDWFSDMVQYGFSENLDFTSFTEKRVKPQGGRPSVDHAMKLDMAKEISMIQRTEKGKEARRYFIEVEKQYQQQLPTDPMELLRLTFAAQENTNKKVERVEERVADLEENTVLSAGEYSYIGRRINQRVAEVAKGFGNITAEQRGKLYVDINQGVKAVTGVATRTQLRAKHRDTVLTYINDWEPSTATKMQVRQTNLGLDDQTA